MERSNTDKVFALTANELAWLIQEVDRELTTLSKFLGGLSDAERKRARKGIIERCMTTLRKGREKPC